MTCRLSGRCHRDESKTYDDVGRAGRRVWRIWKVSVSKLYPCHFARYSLFPVGQSAISFLSLPAKRFLVHQCPAANVTQPMRCWCLKFFHSFTTFNPSTVLLRVRLATPARSEQWEGFLVGLMELFIDDAYDAVLFM